MSDLRNIRHSAGLTVEQLAAKAKIAEATVRRAETRRHQPNARTRKALARALGVSVDDIFHPEDATTPANGGLER